MSHYELILTEGLVIVDVRDGSGVIKSTLKYEIPEGQETQADFAWAQAMDVVEALILAHACAGIDIGQQAYTEGVNTVLAQLERELW